MGIFDGLIEQAQDLIAGNDITSTVTDAVDNVSQVGTDATEAIDGVVGDVQANTTDAVTNITDNFTQPE